MELISSKSVNRKERPVKVLQFGEGNFLRGFVDYMIDIANEKGEFDGNIVLVKPIEFGSLERFKKQDCFYTVSLRGITDGKAVFIEVKTAHGRPSKEQINFIRMMNSYNAVAGICRSVEEAIKLLERK